MQRVIIIGDNGSGKTTFAIKLAQKTGLPLVHLDRLYWQDNWIPTPKSEYDALLQAELEKPCWILDGNMNRTIPLRLSYCDTAFYFDFPTVECLRGAIMRVIKNYGKSRPDMGGNCPERFDLSFYKAILKFNKQHRRDYHKLLSEAESGGKTVVIFKNRRQVEKYLKMMSS